MTKLSSAAPSALRDLVADDSLGGLAFAAAYSDAADTWMRELLGDTPGVALLAVGAYGRSELCPASDLDLVLIHDGKRSRDVGAIADRIWYPIWDSGIALDHSVRTVREARAVAMPKLIEYEFELRTANHRNQMTKAQGKGHSATG